MKNIRTGPLVRLRHLGMASALVAGFTVLPTYAQSDVEQLDVEQLGAEAADAAGEPAVELGSVQVTGSRIKQMNLTSSSPVTIINDSEITYQGTVRVEDLINSLPQAFADQGGNLSNGATGTATVNLRNLGSARTLVLIDGKRMNSGDPRELAADLNTIPAALIQRVEIVTGGASAVYGSDAVAGVVNFIMKKDFEGVQLDYQHNFYMHENDNSAASARLDAAGFQKPSNSVTDGQGDTLSIVMGSNAADGLGNSTVYAIFRNLNALRQSERDFSACAVGGGSQSCRGSFTSAPANFASFDPNVENEIDYTLDGTSLREPTGADLFNFAPFNYYQRNNENISLGGMFSREVNETTLAYVNISFTEDKTNGVIAPSGVFGTVDQVRCDNPLLSPDQVQKFCTDRGYAPDDSANVFIFRRNVEGGARDDDLTHQSLRSVFGLEGEFDYMGSWSYDIFGQFSRAKLNQIYRNDMSILRQNRAIDAVDDGNGNIVCRSVLDGTDPNCVVYNIFDSSVAVDPAALAYMQVPGLLSGSTEQKIVGATVSGALDEVFMPGSSQPIGLAFGVERRSEEAVFESDLSFSTGDLAGQGGATVGTGGKYDLFEVFAEARLPLLQGYSWAYDLNLDLGYRFSDYSSTSSTNTYKAQMNWALNPDLTVRGGYNRAVRAPNIVEIAEPASVNLAGNSDPCAGDPDAVDDDGEPDVGARPSASAEQCANDPLIAQRPELYGNISQNPAGQYNGLYGSVPGLEPEIADTYTLGAVFTPSFVKNLSVTVDYYDIEVDGLIDRYGADTILRECYESNNLCDLINRDPNTGSLWLQSSGYVNNQILNTGSRHIQGVDLGINYRYDLNDYGMLNMELVGAYNMTDDVQPVPGGATFDCAGKYGLACEVPKPTWRHKLRTRWLTPYNGIEGSLAWRYLGGVEADSATIEGAPAAERQLASYSYIDLAATIPWDRFDFRVGINNLLDKDPPVIGKSLPGVVGSGNTFPQIYDALGRYIFMGVSADF